MGQTQSTPNVPELVFRQYDSKGNKVIAKYRVVKELGSGGFGKVYQVEMNGNSYALKLIRGLPKDEMEKAKGEVAVLQNLDHKSIVKYYTSFIMKDGEGSALAIVMELVVGPDLGKFLKNQITPLPIEWIIRVFLELLNVLSFMHRNLIAHRDIKPPNILIDNVGNTVKLADFGLAKTVAHTSETLHGVAGTIPYFAPEIVNPRLGKVTIRTDIYSLGVVLYQVLTLDDSFCSRAGGFSGCIEKDSDLIEKNVVDYGVRKILEQMIEESPERRVTACDLLESKILQSWKVITIADFDFRKEEMKKLPLIPCKDTLSPFIAVLTRKTTESIIRDSLEYIKLTIKELSVREAFLELNGIKKVCDLIVEDSSQLPMNFRLKRAELCDTKNEINNSNIDNDIDTIAIIGNSYSRPVKNIALDILVSMLTEKTTDIASANQIYCSGCLSLFIEEFKIAPDLTHNLFTALCKFTFIQKTLFPLGFEYIVTSYLESSSFYRSSMFIFEQFKYNTNKEGIKYYLNHILERSTFASEKVKERISKLISSRKNSHKLINKANSQTWSEVIHSCLDPDILKKSSNDIWFFCLLKLIIPIDKLIFYQLKNNICTKSVTGNCNFTRQLLFTCLTCNDNIYRCFSCSNFCDFDDHYEYAYIYDYNYCQCNELTCKCKSPSSANNEKIPLITNTTSSKLFPSTNLRHKIPKLIVHSLKFKTSPDLHSKSPNCYYFNDKGISISHINDSIPNGIQFYFEIKIKSIPISFDKSSFQIGISSTVKSISQNIIHLLGQSEGEFSYNNTNGKLLKEGQEKSYGPFYSNYDIIGCGITNHRRLFFTYNGIFLGYTGVIITQSSVQYASFSMLGDGFNFQIFYNHFYYGRSHHNDKIIKSPSSFCNFYALEILFKNRCFKNFLLSLTNSNDLTDNLLPNDIISALFFALDIFSPGFYHSSVVNNPYLGIFNTTPSFLMDVFNRYNTWHQNNNNNNNLPSSNDQSPQSRSKNQHPQQVPQQQQQQQVPQQQQQQQHSFRQYQQQQQQQQQQQRQFQQYQQQQQQQYQHNNNYPNSGFNQNPNAQQFPYQRYQQSQQPQQQQHRQFQQFQQQQQQQQPFRQQPQSHSNFSSPNTPSDYDRHRAQLNQNQRVDSSPSIIPSSTTNQRSELTRFSGYIDSSTLLSSSAPNTNHLYNNSNTDSNPSLNSMNSNSSRSNYNNQIPAYQSTSPHGSYQASSTSPHGSFNENNINSNNQNSSFHSIQNNNNPPIQSNSNLNSFSSSIHLQSVSNPNSINQNNNANQNSISQLSSKNNLLNNSSEISMKAVTFSQNFDPSVNQPTSSTKNEIPEQPVHSPPPREEPVPVKRDTIDLVFIYGNREESHSFPNVTEGIFNTVTDFVKKTFSFKYDPNLFYLRDRARIFLEFDGQFAQLDQGTKISIEY